MLQPKMVKSGSIKIRKKRASDADLESSKKSKNKNSKSKTEPSPKPNAAPAKAAATTTMATLPDDNLAKVAKLVNTKAKKAKAKENKAIAQLTAGKKKAKGSAKPQHQVRASTVFMLVMPRGPGRVGWLAARRRGEGGRGPNL